MYSRARLRGRLRYSIPLRDVEGGCTWHTVNGSLARRQGRVCQWSPLRPAAPCAAVASRRSPRCWAHARRAAPTCLPWRTKPSSSSTTAPSSWAVRWPRARARGGRGGVTAARQGLPSRRSPLAAAHSLGVDQCALLLRTCTRGVSRLGHPKGCALRKGLAPFSKRVHPSPVPQCHEKPAAMCSFGFGADVGLATPASPQCDRSPHCDFERAASQCWAEPCS